MAMNMGGSGGVRSEINITPLVDVVLVLLIIFMVAVPLLQMGYAVQVPPKVEYTLTKWGQAMCPALDELLEWAAARPRQAPA